MTGFNDLIASSAESVVYEDLRVSAGASWDIAWTVMDSEDEFIDFSSCTARCDIRDKVGGVLLNTWTSTPTDGREIFLGSSGEVSLRASEEDTTAYAQGGDYNGVYEIEIFNGTETVKFVRGNIKIFGEITTSG